MVAVHDQIADSSFTLTGIREIRTRAPTASGSTATMAETMKEVASAMRWRPAIGLVVVCAVVVQWAAGSQLQNGTRSEARPLLARSVAYEPTALTGRILRNTLVGFRLTYPRGWRVVRKVIATEFAVGATCQSVQMIDFASASDSGPGAKVLQSFVQICWRRVSGGETLPRFVDRTYGTHAERLLEQTTFGGVPAYRTKDGEPNGTIFLQTNAHRIQIVASVVAEPAKRDMRSEQVRRILASFAANP